MDFYGVDCGRGSWAVGGFTLVGLGVGFFFLHISVMFFVASLLIGMGLGLVVAALISGKSG